MKRSLVALLALFGASVVTAPAMAQGNFLDFAKGTAGVLVAGAVVCTVTNTLGMSGLAVCTPSQAQYGRPIQQQQAYLLPQQHPMYQSQQQLQYRYLGRVYVPAGQQPGVGSNVAPPATSQLPTLDEAVAKATAALGGKPTDGRKYGGVSVLADNSGFKCPSGQAATRVKHVSVQGYDLDRWFCP